MPPAVILTDIEGTTTPIAFVRDVLFPFARARLPDLLRAQAGQPEVAAELRAVAELAPGQDALATLLGWMDQDAKVTPLKALQGMLWRDGYREGAIQGAMYPDVAPALRAWAAAGRQVAVYSSGSEEAQRLIFTHSAAGDLSDCITAYFDTRIGAKRDAASYRRIAQGLQAPPGSILFLSDIEAELDAAAEAGLATCQLVRPADATVPSPRHRLAADFNEVSRIAGLVPAKG